MATSSNEQHLLLCPGWGLDVMERVEVMCVLCTITTNVLNQLMNLRKMVSSCFPCIANRRISQSFFLLTHTATQHYKLKKKKKENMEFRVWKVCKYVGRSPLSSRQTWPCLFCQIVHLCSLGGVYINFHEPPRHNYRDIMCAEHWLSAVQSMQQTADFLFNVSLLALSVQRSVHVGNDLSCALLPTLRALASGLSSHRPAV